MNLKGADYTGMSNAELDAAYAAVYQQYTTTTGSDKVQVAITLNDLYQEIVTREETAGSAFMSLFTSRFPQFDAIQKTGQAPGGFIATDTSRASVVESAGKVATTVEQGAASLLKGTAIVAAIAGVAALWFFFGRKK